MLELSAEDRAALGRRVVDLWRDDNEDRATWLRRLPGWLLAYQGPPVPKAEPYPGAANLWVPLTAWHLDAIHAREMAALIQPDPVTSMKPQEPSDDARARKAEQFLDWAVREEIRAFPVLDRAIQGKLIHGLQFTKQAWELETRHLRTVHEFPADLLPDEVIQAVLAGEQQFLEALERVDGTAASALKQDREIVLEVTQRATGTLQVITEREEVVFDAPRMTLIDPEDLAVNDDAPYDLQRADHVLHRYYLTPDQIRRLVRRQVFQATDDELEELLRLASGEKTPPDDTAGVREARDRITGTTTTSRAAEPDTVELIDAYLGHDVNDDGLEEQVIVTVVKDQPDLVLRVERLETVFRHGLRPFVAWYCYPVAGTFWAIGIPQVLEGIQTELNTIHNQRVDAGEISNRPFGWYVPAAGFNPEKIPIDMGMLNPVADINQVKMHTPANYTAWGFQEEANLLAIAERRTKVNDLTIGRIGETQGATRTASGVNALSAQQAAGFDVQIRRAQESWRLCLQQFLALYAQYMPPGKTVRVLGKYADSGETLVTREDLRGHFDLRFTGNSLSTDREIERQVYTFLAQGPMGPTTLQFLLQLGVTTPQGIAEFYRAFLEVFDLPRIDRMIRVPPDTPLKTPEEIINRTLGGERVEIYPGEQHQAVIDGLTALLNGPEALGFAPETVVVMRDQVTRRTQQAQHDLLVQQIQMVLSAQAMTGAPGAGAAPESPAGPNAPAMPMMGGPMMGGPPAGPGPAGGPPSSPMVFTR